MGKGDVRRESQVSRAEWEARYALSFPTQPKAELPVTATYDGVAVTFVDPAAGYEPIQYGAMIVGSGYIGADEFGALREYEVRTRVGLLPSVQVPQDDTIVPETGSQAPP